MVDSIVDSLVSLAIEKLAKVLEDEVVLLVGVTNEIKKLSSTFTLIQAVLKDAETRRLKDEAVKKWLENLKDVAYDVDDILDEWMTEALKSQAPDEGGVSRFSKKKVTRFLSPVINCFNYVVLRWKFASRMKEVRGRLDDIEKDKNLLGLRVDSGERERVDSEVRRGEIRERETGSLPNQLSIVGREGEKNEILEFLLGESSGEVEVMYAVISIVGMGGLGKTTLAQLAYNDEKVKGHFDMRMWVCVSEDFDVKRITKSSIESATGTGCESLDLAPLQDRLRHKLHSNRFLLVLDDVWSTNNEMWDKLIPPFQEGARGSRIIVTTRSEDVAWAMGRGRIHKLAGLSFDDCWLLFSRGALEHQSERSELEVIGKKIVMKCGGVPLAAKTIGSAMGSRRTRREWELILESDVWNSNDVLQGILPALLLSYYDLPPALKQCFAYLSVFQKDWWIEKDMIVKLWVAQGFIGTRDMEETGGLYFDDLLRRSLLQDAELDDDDDQKVVSCKMHDLVHDLAQSVAGSECSVVEMRKQSSLNLNNLRHLFLIDSDDAGDRDWATLYKAQKLRTLLRDSTISRVPNNLFHHFRHLRALDLSYTSIQKLPPTVGKLKHLRYLDLSWTKIEELPEEVSNCRNLQTLKLNWCLLQKLPRGMGKMIGLRHVELEGTGKLKYLPQGIGKLSSLRTLTKFIVGGDDEGCKWGELKHLNHLQGSLYIKGLENVRSRDEAREAELNKKQYLHSLTFEYDDEASGDDEQKRTEEVLEILQPHTNLKELRIWRYGGSKFPKWTEDPVFSNLVKVELFFCFKCKQLPGLGKLPSLKYLYIEGMKEVRKVGGEFSGDDNNDGSGGGVVSFPKLESLSFIFMTNWEEWELRGGDDGEVMPSLLELGIHYCPKLQALPSNLPPLLQKLTLCGSDVGMSSGVPLPVLPNLNHLEIWRSDEMTSFPSGWLGQLKALQTLEIKTCFNLRSLPEELQHLTMLQKLDIWHCPELTSLPEELQHLTMLQQLYIRDCPVLEERCREGGEDRYKIAHIPNITIFP
ncbi:disease resistance protein RGA2-like isoform X1 [Magnolia sinica]|uniref:disease resistance protein RGA2-like isoform X1 n=1 Tax=Magnolia sinica TaxID=86752 RepID=UPI0026588471|nr:disease resistance protein RGA2-like isoform X1 [Magnolia sinica]